MRVPRKVNGRVDWMIIRAKTAVVALVIASVGMLVDGVIYQLWYLPSVGASTSLLLDLRAVISYFTTLPGVLAQVPIVLGIGVYFILGIIEYFAD